MCVRFFFFFLFFFVFFLQQKHAVGSYLNGINITKIIFVYMVVNCSSVKMTGNYSPNIQQNIIELTLGTAF